MRRSPNASRLHAGAAPEAEVVQHVGELVRVVGGLCEVLVQQLSLVVRIGGHCDGVPGLDENCLEIVCHPVALGAGILDSEKNVPGRENGSFSDGVDSQRKMTFRVLIISELSITRTAALTAMVLQDVFPPLPVEHVRVEGKVLVEKFRRLLDHLSGDDGPDQPPLQHVLETEENCFVKFSTATFEVGEHSLDSRRVLEVMSYLVRVSHQ